MCVTSRWICVTCPVDLRNCPVDVRHCLSGGWAILRSLPVPVPAWSVLCGSPPWVSRRVAHHPRSPSFSPCPPAYCQHSCLWHVSHPCAFPRLIFQLPDGSKSWPVSFSLFHCFHCVGFSDAITAAAATCRLPAWQCPRGALTPPPRDVVALLTGLCPPPTVPCPSPATGHLLLPIPLFPRLEG